MEKREVQKKLIPLIKRRKLVTLAGPNVRAYLAMFPPRIKNVEIWENNRQIMLQQMEEIASITDRKVSYNFGNITNAEVDEKAFYDLDFCRTIRDLQRCIAKFRHCAFSATFANRDCSVEKTITLFLEAVGEEKIVDVYHPQFNLLKTNENSYLYTTHCDSSPMTTIFKFHQ